MQNIITSPTHPLIKRLVRLKNEKKERTLSNSALMMGEHIIEELSSRFILKTLLIKQGFSHSINLSDQTQIFYVNDLILKKVTGLQSTQNLVGEFLIPETPQLIEWNRILIFDRVQDPTNFGVLTRTAIAMGFSTFFLTPGCCDPFNEKALRGARGSTFYCHIHHLESDEIIQKLATHNVQLYCAHMDGKSVEKTSFKSPFALVLGNEGDGVDSSFLRNALAVSIEMENVSESLNVAVAGSILMHEMRKKR